VPVAGAGVGAGVGAAVGAVVGADVGTGVGASVGSGVTVGSGVDTAVGMGVPVGLGVGVGSGVGVGTGVFSSIMGGWSPTTGGSAVGRVENMPGGAVGGAAGCPSESPHDSIVSRATPTAAILKSVPNVFRPSFITGISKVTPSRF
jgi:hypothetical protein